MYESQGNPMQSSFVNKTGYKVTFHPILTGNILFTGGCKTVTTS